MPPEEPAPRGYREIPPGYRATYSAVSLNTFDAFAEGMDDRREETLWQDGMEAIALAIWERLPEAEDRFREARENPDDLTELVDFALRVGVTLGIGLVRTYPSGPEQLADWIHHAALYAGWDPCEYQVIHVRDEGDTDA